MAVLSLPLSFSNSFWTQDYRKGLEVLYDKLEQGASENTEILAFIRARAQAEDDIGVALARITKTTSGTAFGADDGATLLMAFRGLQSETAQQGGVHQAIARELHQLVADPFEKWAEDYHERTQASRATVIDGYIKKYELSQAEVIKLKNTYLSKVRKADEAEEDSHRTAELTDKYTTSPRLHPRERPVRTATISERIAQKFKDIQRKASDLAEGSPNEEKSQVLFSDDKEGPKIDKGKGKAVNASPPPLSPQLPPTSLDIKASSPTAPPEPSEPMLLAGLSLSPAAVSDLLSRASAELKLQSISFPIVGEYQCFTGEDFVAWLNVNVQGFGGSFERAEEAAKELTERDGLLRRIGDIGNAFEPVDDAFYLFRPKAFELGKHGAPHSPTKHNPVAGNLIKRSNNFLNVVSKALAANANGEPPLVRARLDADAADREYRIARLGLEERIEDTLKLLQRWETERLYAVKAGTAPLERSASHIAAYLPDSDLSALIERYRTGPFRPQPQVYESVAHDESDVLFGIDLRRWSEGGWSTLHGEAQDKPLVPPVLTALLDGLQHAYPKLPNDDDGKLGFMKSLLLQVHHLRESLNAVPPEQPIPADIMTNYDTPVLASAVKLWLLELDPPISLWEGWEDLRRLYPNVGSAEKGPTDEYEHLEALKMALLRLPKVHLYVLDALVLHLKALIENTDVEETDEVYVTKLALSIGRTVLRPKSETSVSVQDRHPTAFFVDLVKHHADVLPPTIAKKRADTERKVPLRKRTAPVDMRMSRSRLSAGAIPPPVPSVTCPPAPVSAPPPPPAVQTIPPPPPLKPTPAPEPPRVVAPVPVPAARAANPAVPARPAFKSPPPEDDDVPPRPAFTSPPPESDRESPAPAPVSAHAQAHASAPAAAPVKVSPPTPVRRNSGSPRPGPMRTSSPRVRSPSNSSSPLAGGAGLRSPSPAVSQSEDAPLNSNRASLSRTTSTEASRAARQPRGGRPLRGGAVSSIVSGLNRNSVASDPRTSPPPSAGLQRGARGRPSSVVEDRRRSLTGLARRTMDSDAEEGVVG
ncbi:hypothetical protein EDB83DRAFT_2352927 [Lactarius deliciosus]|nr:hypothetical protein EDB83DRAFT_2352927 [Lactarius deliciosus]